MLRWLKSLIGPAGRTDAHALFRLGQTALAQGRQADAALHLRRAIHLDADVPEFHRHLALACRAQGDLSGAETAYRAALALEPGDLATRIKLGSVCTKLGQLDAAQQWLEGAVRAAPASAEAHFRLGELLLEQRLPDKAAAAYAEAARLDPGSARTRVALGRALETAGAIDAALERYEEALRLDPQSVDAHVSRATIWLSQGRFGPGWDEFEWRRRAPDQAALHDRFRAPDWEGSDLAGRTLLFYAEQGLGDQIMYASCLPQILQKAKRCVIDCDPRLVPLFRRAFPAALVQGGQSSDAGGWADAHAVDFKLACASAPRYLRRSAADFPAHAGYLHADAAKVERWRKRLATLGPGPKIGLSWRGGVQRTGRSWRSLELDALVPILSKPGLQFVSLQYDVRPGELARLRDAHNVNVHHWPEAIDDYDETAALLCALDLTVSVCTAVIHLAGALGCPVWILAPVKADARYGLHGSAMPWYPAARLFRQRAFGDWAGVLGEVSAALQGFGKA